MFPFLMTVQIDEIRNFKVTQELKCFGVIVIRENM